MTPPSTVTCPKCGMQVSGSGPYCPLCQARLQPITLRRMGLWAVIAILIFVILIFWVISRP